MAIAAVQPQTILTIGPKHRIVEGVATDGRTIWVSSILDRQILACHRSCKSFATLPTGMHPFAIAWDASRKRLWVAADCPPGVAGIKACDRGALIALNPAGHIVSRIASASGSFHPGDVSAAARGVFVSDSQNGAIYQLSRTGAALTAVVRPAVGKSGQGTALGRGGKALMSADYSQGVGVIDLATGARKILPRTDGKPLRGIDGLVRCGSKFYGIYNGASPGALLAIETTEAGLKFEQVAELPDPTQLAIDGDRLLIVADSGWATLDKPGFARTAGATIVAIPVKCDAQ